MSQDIKTLRNRIKSVDSTMHLTKAMGLVASSKIRRATENMMHGREYRAALDKTMSALTACAECHKSPYMQNRGTNRNRIIVVAGDKGMAGGYNANIFRFMKDYSDAEIIAIGKRACDRYDKPFCSSEHFETQKAYDIASQQCDDFANGNFDALYVVSTKYISALSQVPIITQLLPLVKSTEKQNSVIFEPDELEILNSVVKEYVAGVLAALVKESFASEVAARRAAMDSADKNAGEMLESLRLSYNRARQGAITQEITEIVAGSGI